MLGTLVCFLPFAKTYSFLIPLGLLIQTCVNTLVFHVILYNKTGPELITFSFAHLY